MQGKASVLGHSIHPMLIVFPLGLLGLVPVVDVLGFATRDPVFGSVAYWMCSFGIIGALVAAVPGFIDWLSIPRGTRAYRTGLMHMLLMLATVAFFVISWFTRRAAMPGASFALALIGLVVVAVGGWFGGELVEEHGMSVRPGAGLDAPSSLESARRQHSPIAFRPLEPKPS